MLQRCLFVAIVARRRSAEERGGITHHLIHPAVETGSRREGDLSVWRYPVDAPIERTDDPVVGSCGQTAFPRVKDSFDHNLNRQWLCPFIPGRAIAGRGSIFLARCARRVRYAVEQRDKISLRNPHNGRLSISMAAGPLQPSPA